MSIYCHAEQPFTIPNDKNIILLESNIYIYIYIYIYNSTDGFARRSTAVNFSIHPFQSTVLPNKSSNH
jgi:hypothetical protein